VKFVAYIESNLLPDEEIVYRAHIHWIIFLKSFIVIGFGLALLWAEPSVGGIGVGLGLLIGIPAFIQYKTSEFGVTTKRVIVKVGLIRRRTLELLLRQVEAILIDQTVPGRIFDYGSVTLTGTGGVREMFHNISSPLEFRKQIQGQAA
jgi:uncharacterized membrane protein YdbT with pleckstrin-like domain